MRNRIGLDDVLKKPNLPLVMCVLSVCNEVYVTMGKLMLEDSDVLMSLLVSLLHHTTHCSLGVHCLHCPLSHNVNCLAPKLDAQCHFVREIRLLFDNNCVRHSQSVCLITILFWLENLRKTKDTVLFICLEPLTLVYFNECSSFYEQSCLIIPCTNCFTSVPRRLNNVVIPMPACV
jgi:hypothetical protein